jgi:hypothetical protein
MEQTLSLINEWANWYFWLFLVFWVPALILGGINHYYIGNAVFEQICFILIILGIIPAAQMIGLADLRDAIRKQEM